MNIKRLTWVVPLALLVAGVVAVRYWQNEKFEEAVSLLLAAEANEVSSLCIVENYECIRRVVLDDEIRRFLSAVADIEEFTVPKASDGESVTVIVLEPQNVLIQARIRPEDSFAFGGIGFVDDAFSTKYVGSFKSEGLRQWIQSSPSGDQSQQ